MAGPRSRIRAACHLVPHTAKRSRPVGTGDNSSFLPELNTTRSLIRPVTRHDIIHFSVMLIQCACLALQFIIIIIIRLGVTCSPRDAGFTGSNPAEVGGFFQDAKILSTSPPGGTSAGTLGLILD